MTYCSTTSASRDCFTRRHSAGDIGESAADASEKTPFGVITFVKPTVRCVRFDGFAETKPSPPITSKNTVTDRPSNNPGGKLKWLISTGCWRSLLPIIQQAAPGEPGTTVWNPARERSVAWQKPLLASDSDMCRSFIQNEVVGSISPGEPDDSEPSRSLRNLQQVSRATTQKG